MTKPCEDRTLWSIEKDVQVDQRQPASDESDPIAPRSPSTRPLFRPAPYPVNEEVSGSASSLDPPPPPPMDPPATTATTSMSGAVVPPRPPVEKRSASESIGNAFRAIARNWPVLIPIALFALAAMIVPTMTNIATTDDWGYTRSVEILYWDIRLMVFPVVAATAIGQVFWGGLFALIFGMDLGVMRLSTVVAVAIGAVALYALLRLLGVSKGRSSMGTALYLFNPLSFILSFTFMTDPHFTSWLLVALAFYVWGVRADRPRAWAVVLGSVAAGYAFWIRQQGALIPLAVVLYLIATRQVWFNRHGVKLALQVALAPAAMLVVYYVWLTWFNDVTAVQQGFFDEMTRHGWEGAWFLVRYLTYFEVVYLGLILIPLALAILPTWRNSRDHGSFRSPLGYWLFLGVLGIAISGLYVLTSQGRRMPYIPQFVGSGGLGANDVPGGRMRLIEWPQIYDAVTVMAVIGAIVAGLMICRHLIPDISPERSAAGLVAMVGLWQVVGVLPPSFHYLTKSGSLDRYLLPLIPIAIALLLWTVRDVRLFQPIGWIAIACFAVFSVAGTRDYLVYMDAVWSMAKTANIAGVPNTKLDAGSGWDGYHLYTDMIDDGVTKAISPGGSPWWIYFYAKNTDSTYIVTTNPARHKGYVVVEQHAYDQWLEDDTVSVYLVRKKDAPWPPISVP